MTEAKEIREYADLIQAEALRRKVSVLALLDQLEREEECYLAGWNECEEAIRKMASPDVSEVTDRQRSAGHDFNDDLAKVQSKTYWAEESSCMEETFGTVQRVVSELYNEVGELQRLLVERSSPVTEEVPKGHRYVERERGGADHAVPYPSVVDGESPFPKDGRDG